MGSVTAGFLGAGVSRKPPEARGMDMGGVEIGLRGADTFEVPPEDNPDKLKSPRPLAYRVEFSDPPMTVPFPKKLEVSSVLFRTPHLRQTEQGTRVLRDSRGTAVVAVTIPRSSLVILAD